VSVRLNRRIGAALRATPAAGLVPVFQRWRHRQRAAQLYARYRDATMVPLDCFADTLGLCRTGAPVAGAVVECGVWRGGMIAAMAEVLGPARCYYLFDSFEGLPPADAAKDGARAVRQASSVDPARRLVAEMRWTEQAMRLSGATRYELVPGWFKDTLARFTPPEPIAVLRLDGDWYESTLQCLEALYPHVTPGGLVLIDDYYAWDGCARAVHEYLARQPDPAPRLRESAAWVAYLWKPL